MGVGGLLFMYQKPFISMKSSHLNVTNTLPIRNPIYTNPNNNTSN